MLLTDSQAVTLDFRTAAWGQPPYNGMTAYRPDFDHWLARKAEADGAELLCSTTATGLLLDGDRVVGVRTDRPDGDVTAGVVIACDGVNSFLAKEAGLFHSVDAANYTLGVKETIAVPKAVIDERFAVREREGVDIEILGGTSGVGGGAFLYTNLDTLGVGVVLKLSALAAQSVRPETIIAALKTHPSIAPLVDGGKLVEYSAHLIPEAGASMIPTLATNGMVVAGDAASLCLAAGIWLEGVNFAMASGMYAGEAVDDALRARDVTVAGLAGYERRLSSTFVLRDHRKLRRVPSLVLSDRVQHEYPQLAANVVERMFRVDNPEPKPGLRRIVREERRRAGIRLRHLARDAWIGMRGFG
jgi:electron transfer flavoprotein-quinone oxidoreductase